MSITLKKQSQEEFLSSIKKGDSVSFCALYDTYSGVVYSVINKLCDDGALSEEILQSSFIRIWKSISTFNPEKQRLLAWMLSVTRQVAGEVLEAQKLNKNFKIQTDTNYVCDNKGVLLLIYFKGYSLQKAAELLNISLEEVKSRLKSEFDLMRAKS